MNPRRRDFLMALCAAAPANLCRPFRLRGVSEAPKEPPTSPDLAPVSRANASHYVWGDNCDGWYLVRSDKLSVIEEQMPPGTAEVLHYHKESQQFFYMLSGDAVVEAGEEKIPVLTGQGIRILPTIPHRIVNSSNNPIRFLVISQPPSHDDRVNLGS